jgi:hypothetical protein
MATAVHHYNLLPSGNGHGAARNEFQRTRKKLIAHAWFLLNFFQKYRIKFCVFVICGYFSATSKNHSPVKRNTAQSNNIAQVLPSIKNLESPPAAALATAQWQQYAEAASRFAAEWAHEMDEKGEAHSFWDEFLQIFNIRRRQFARHEARAKRSDNRRGFIDLFWPGKLLVEHKAGHKNKADDFDEALRQAMDYIGELEAKDRPQKLVLCNFKTFQVYEVSAPSQAVTSSHRLT